MATSFNFYDCITRDMQNGDVIPDDDTFYMMIVTATYVPSRTAHTKRSDITNEVSGAGYTAAGAEITNFLLTLDTTNHRTKVDADDFVLNPVTFTNGRYGIIYKRRGGASSADELVAWVDFGGNQSPSAASFTVQWDSIGLWDLAVIP